MNIEIKTVIEEGVVEMWKTGIGVIITKG